MEWKHTAMLVNVRRIESSKVYASIVTSFDWLARLTGRELTRLDRLCGHPRRADCASAHDTPSRLSIRTIFKLKININVIKYINISINENDVKLQPENVS